MIESFRGDHWFLSNLGILWNPVKYDHILFPSVEHGFQAAKTMDIHQRKYIRDECKTGSQARKLGRTLTLRDDWDTEIKLPVMYDLVLQKFQNNKGLRKLLLETHKEQMVEGNKWHDNYWGSCGCHKCKEKDGQNHLGKILMRVRNELG